MPLYCITQSISVKYNSYSVRIVEFTRRGQYSVRAQTTTKLSRSRPEGAELVRGEHLGGTVDLTLRIVPRTGPPRHTTNTTNTTNTTDTVDKAIPRGQT